MALGRPLGAKVFLEGKEVPLIGATITSSVNQASIAYIDLVPQAEIINIKPRTHVEIAVRDYNNIDEDYPFVTAWEGEVFGYSFSKEVTGRSFSVQAIDLSSYWDNVLTFFLNTNAMADTGGRARIAMGQDVQTAEAQGFKVNTTIGGPDISYFVQLINDEIKKPGKDFLDAIFAVYKSISNVNDFYNAAEKRFRIRDHVVLRSSGALGNLLDQANNLKHFNGIVDRSGGFTSLRQVIQNLINLIFHDFVPIPFPSRVQRDNLDGDALKSSDTVKRTIGSFVLKPSLYMIPPPMCNVFFPDEYSQFVFNRNFFREPTRLIYQPVLPSYGSGEPWSTKYVYEPPSFSNFMQGKAPWSDFRSDGDFAVSDEPGHWGEEDKNTTSKETNGSKKRECQFLTDEERLKGILLSREAMLPVNNEFQATSLPELAKASFAQGVAKYLFYKKRFEGRTLQITSHLKMSVVPGFPILLLDDSDAKQNVAAYCTSVTHRVYATQGGYTNVSLTYARTVDEQQQSNNKDGSPIVPSFYATDIFGAAAPPAGTSAAAAGLQELTPPPATQSKLAAFYEALLGSKGSKPVTDYSADAPTLKLAVEQILSDYRKRRENGSEDVQDFIAFLTARDYVKIEESMKYKGATTATKNITTENFTDFLHGAFETTDQTFGTQVTTRLQPIDLYREALKNLRGFRG